MLHISFHASIDYRTVNFTERLLAEQIGHENPGATIYLATGGGDAAAGISLFQFIKALPYPVHVHAMGMCASGGVGVLLAATRRTCSAATYFMLHGAKASDGTLAAQAPATRAIYETELGWESAMLDHFFATVDEKWFPASYALEHGLIQTIEEISFPAEEPLHIVPAS